MLKNIIKMLFCQGQVAQLVGLSSHIMDSIPVQGTYLGCKFDPWLGHVQEAADQCFSLTLMFLFPFLSFYNQYIYLQVRIKKYFTLKCSGLQISVLGGGKWPSQKFRSPLKDKSSPDIPISYSEHPLDHTAFYVQQTC